MPELKMPTKIGTVVIALGGLSATMTAESAAEWLELIAQYSPLALSAWLIYIVYLIDQERTELRSEISKLRTEIAVLRKTFCSQNGEAKLATGDDPGDDH